MIDTVGLPLKDGHHERCVVVLIDGGGYMNKDTWQRYNVMALRFGSVYCRPPSTNTHLGRGTEIGRGPMRRDELQTREVIACHHECGGSLVVGGADAGRHGAIREQARDALVVALAAREQQRRVAGLVAALNVGAMQEAGVEAGQIAAAGVIEKLPVGNGNEMAQGVEDEVMRPRGRGATEALSHNDSRQAYLDVNINRA